MEAAQSVRTLPAPSDALVAALHSLCILCGGLHSCNTDLSLVIDLNYKNLWLLGQEP